VLNNFKYYEYFVELRQLNNKPFLIMKKLVILLLAIASNAVTFAQNPDKALARVRYTFTHITDTTAKDKPHTENMLLVIGKNASVYTSYDKINRDLQIQQKIQEQIKNQAGGGTLNIKLDAGSSTQVTDIDYYYFAKEQKLITKERLFSNYLVTEDAPKINWKLEKDTATFSGIKCQKATANFKGRNWIAWYATDLPFQSGPWKLNGLPGLIIEAYDQKKEVKFQFAGMENVKDEAEAEKAPQISIPGGGIGTVKLMGMDSGTSYLGAEIKLPTDAVNTSAKELVKLKAAKEADPQGFLNAQMAANGMQMSTRQSTSIRSSPSGPPKKVINNPIERSENK
jgi:GLPGLI family protein